MRWLSRRGYSAISLETLLAARRGVGQLPARPVVITFDDGFQDCADHAAAVLQRHGFAAVFYVVAGVMGGTSRWLRAEVGLELSLRLARAGVTLVFCPDALSRQHYEKDFAALARDTMAKGRTAVLFARKHPEVYPQLKLSMFAQESRKRYWIRRGLLQLGRVWRGTPDAIVAAVIRLERHRPRLLHTGYSIALDFFYWLGAASAAREGEAATGGEACPAPARQGT